MMSVSDSSTALIVPYGITSAAGAIHSVRRIGSGAGSRVASTTTSAPRTASSIVSTTRTGVSSAADSRAPNAARDSARALVTRISSSSSTRSSSVTLANAVPRAPMWASTRAPRRARCRAPRAVTAPVRHSVIAVASRMACGTPVRGSYSVSRASSDGRPSL